MSVNEACYIKLMNSKTTKKVAAITMIEKYFAFLGENESMKGAIADKIKRAFTNQIVIDENINYSDVFKNVDKFVKFISSGTFDSLKDINIVSKDVDPAKLSEQVNDYLRAFSDVAANVITKDDLEYLKTNDEMIAHYSEARAYLTYSVGMKKAGDWLENPLVKWLTLNPFTFDRGAYFMSNPIIKPAYEELLKFNSSINDVVNKSINKKELMLDKAKAKGFSNEDLGSIVLVMEHIANEKLANKSAETPIEINTEEMIVIGLKNKFDRVDEGLINNAKDIWKEYRRFNYGSAIGDDLFDLPRDYSPLNRKYGDGFLSMFVQSNVRKARLAKMVERTGNIRTDSEFIKDAIEASKLFTIKTNNGEPILDEYGNPTIDWKWRENYFPHHNEFTNDANMISVNSNESGELKRRSVSEASAAYESQNRDRSAFEIDFVNNLDKNVENARYSMNMSATRLFTSFLMGVSGYQGATERTIGTVLRVGERHKVYSDWTLASNNTGDKENHAVIKHYIDRMTDFFDKEIDFDGKADNALFKKFMMASVGLAATTPLSGSWANNLSGAASQAANEFGIKDMFSMANDWFSEATPGSTEAYIKDEIMASNKFGVKLKKHSAVEYKTDGVEAKGIMKLVDKIADIGIKTGQIIGEQGIFSPLALPLEAIKASIDLINTKVKYEVLGTASSAIGGMTNMSKDSIFSMSGSEDMILNVESGIKFSMFNSAVKMKNAARRANQLPDMTDAEMKKFVKEYSESVLVKSTVMDKWKYVAGDFSEHAKPFWSWLDLKSSDADKVEILKGVAKQLYGMFRPVGLMVGKSASRSVYTALRSTTGRKRLGYMVFQGLMTANQFTSGDSGLSVPLVSQINPLSQPISAAQTMITLWNIMSGRNVSEDEFKSMYNIIGRTVGGIPFGGTVTRFSEGWLGDNANSFFKGITDWSEIDGGLKNLYDDLADPFYMVKSVTEAIHMNDKSLEKLKSYDQAYSTNGIPMMASLTAMNKPLKQWIKMFRTGSELAQSKFASPDMSNEMLRDAQSNISQIVLSGVGLNSYVKLDAVKANGVAKARREKMKVNKKYADGWRTVFEE